MIDSSDAAQSVWARVVVLSAAGTQVAAWSLSGDGSPDLAAVDAVARLQLAAHRLGLDVTLRDARADLLELLHLAGLAEVIPATPG